MRDYRGVLVKGVFFQVDRCGHPKDDAMPSLFPDSKGSILGLSNKVLFVSEFFWEVEKSV